MQQGGDHTVVTAWFPGRYIGLGRAERFQLGFDGGFEHKPDAVYAWGGFTTYHGNYTKDKASRKHHGYITGMFTSLTDTADPVAKQSSLFTNVFLQQLEMGMTGIYSGCRPDLCKRVETQGEYKRRL